MQVPVVASTRLQKGGPSSVVPEAFALELGAGE